MPGLAGRNQAGPARAKLPPPGDGIEEISPRSSPVAVRYRHPGGGDQRTLREAVSMPVTAVPRYCLCDHAEDDHRSDGACRERDDAGQPCGCREFEAGEED